MERQLVRRWGQPDLELTRSLLICLEIGMMLGGCRGRITRGCFRRIVLYTKREVICNNVNILHTQMDEEDGNQRDSPR